MLQGAQFHMLVNHLPVFGALGGTLVLSWGLVRKQQEVIRTGLGLLCLAAVMALPAYFSGEGAEEAVEHLAGVSESLIESHEDMARWATILTEVLGLSALVSLWVNLRQRQEAVPLVAITLILAMLTSGSMIWTAHLGGLIRHTELRSAPQPVEQGQQQETHSEDTYDD